MTKKLSPFHLLIYVVLILIWGSSFILMKKGLLVFTSAQVAAIRITTACLVLLPFLLFRLKEVEKKKVFYMLLMGLTGSGIPAFLFTEAETQVSSSLAGILNALTPLFVLMLGILFFKMKFTSLKVIGILVGFAGSAMLIVFNSEGGGASNIYYAAMIVVATVLYGLSNNIIMRYLQGCNPILMTAVAMAFMGPFVFAWLMTTDFTQRLHVDGALYSLSSCMILGAFGTSIALVIYNYLIQTTGALFGSTVTYFMPLVAIAWGFADGEPIGAMDFVALLIILFGIYLVRRSK
ncbi:MAG: EamA family transporter [Bacteroidota bacterium]